MVFFCTISVGISQRIRNCHEISRKTYLDVGAIKSRPPALVIYQFELYLSEKLRNTTDSVKILLRMVSHLIRYILQLGKKDLCCNLEWPQPPSIWVKLYIIIFPPKFSGTNICTWCRWRHSELVIMGVSPKCRFYYGGILCTFNIVDVDTLMCRHLYMSKNIEVCTCWHLDNQHVHILFWDFTWLEL